MKLIDNNPIQQRDFSKVIPLEGIHEMRNSGFIFENPTNKVKYRLFINVEQQLFVFGCWNYRVDTIVYYILRSTNED